MINLNKLFLSGKEVLPLVEGGKGIAVSTGLSAGAWAKAGGIGTFSGVNADAHDEDGNLIPVVYKGKTRRERHNELIDYAIKGGITQAKIAHDVASGNGRLHMNVLWEMAGAEKILHGVLSATKGLVHGITCGAGMPYRLAEIATKYNVYYYPIVSSARAFSALWRRAYHKFSDMLGAVVYEDPWLAGGHNGLSRTERADTPEDPYPRVKALRDTLRSLGLAATPIIMAGGVWHLNDWKNWIDNPELGPVAFQFGTRPLLTQESQISDAWKKKLLTLKKGDIYLNKFSPTGFYSSAVENDFLIDLKERSERQVSFEVEGSETFNTPIPFGNRGRLIYIQEKDLENVNDWKKQGYTTLMKTPDNTVVFVTPEQSAQILKDQIDCMGCLSACVFSNWSQGESGTTGRKADPRSFCIQKSLQSIAHGGSVDDNLMFAGHGAYRFGQDPFYKNGFIPTVKELIDRICTGE
ncbi:MAG: nitronate monooxygenase [Rickettsiales bacterium]|nr:nitronate monooxygenase [Rickettsiales bacterium]|tara:strand:- start:6212 stop:7609 length:1398 start_codon:yes stop_codon:yes gene_type:complete